MAEAPGLHPLASAELQDLDAGADKNCAFTEEELALYRQAPNKVVTSRPPMLGYASTALIIVNRMVGTGIFITPTTLAQGTQSVAYSLAFWAIGGVAAVSGAHVFAELGLTIPRLDVNNEGEQFVPRNGGEKNYIEYFFRNHRLLATCVYGIPFVMMANVAGNTLLFAKYVLTANGSNNDVSDWTIRGVAIAVAAFACALHAISRKAGVYLNNAFGLIKIAMLLAILSLGAAYAGGQLGGPDYNANDNIKFRRSTASENLNIHNSTADSSASVYGYAQAFLAVLYAFGGFHHANYVLGEVRDCRNRFKITTITTVACVAILFFLVNLSYMFVVPSGRQYYDNQDTEGPNGLDLVASNFFSILFGPTHGRYVESSLLAFSSLGNIIVQTFIAARVKQEIAKEGILYPRALSKFFAENYSLLPKRFTSKANGLSEDTPAAAFLLHWVFAVILILATKPAEEDSYRLVIAVYSFIVNAVFGSLVGIGLLTLRFSKDSGWSKISASNAWISVITATIYTAANLFPLIGIWIPPMFTGDGGSVNSREMGDNLLVITPYWYTVGTVAVSVLAVGFLWWILLRYVIPSLTGKRLETDREYDFIKDHGAWVMWNEVVSIQWQPRPHD